MAFRCYSTSKNQLDFFLRYSMPFIFNIETNGLTSNTMQDV